MLATATVRRHTSAYVSIRQHTSAYVIAARLRRVLARTCHSVSAVRFESMLEGEGTFVLFECTSFNITLHEWRRHLGGYVLHVC